MTLVGCDSMSFAWLVGWLLFCVCVWWSLGGRRARARAWGTNCERPRLHTYTHLVCQVYTHNHAAHKARTSPRLKKKLPTLCPSARPAALGLAACLCIMV